MIRKIILIGCAIAFTALFFIPQIQPFWLAWWPVYNSATANAATTIAGILGPIISLGTLVVVYFTLREQGRTNRLQIRQFVLQQQELLRQQREFRETSIRQANESFFDLTYKIIERFSETVERQKILFAEVPQISLSIYNGDKVTSYESMGGEKFTRQDELFDFQRKFFTLTQFFDVIARRIESESLTGEQKLVLLDLIDITYGDVLGNAVSDYQRLPNSEQIRPQRYSMYGDFLGQRDRLFLMRQQAEAQSNTESIPFGDIEPV